MTREEIAAALAHLEQHLSRRVQIVRVIVIILGILSLLKYIAVF